MSVEGNFAPINEDNGEDSSDCGDDNPGEVLAIEQLRKENEAMKVEERVKLLKRKKKERKKERSRINRIEMQRLLDENAVLKK